MDSQELATQIHRLDSLARLHMGLAGAIGYSRILEKFVLWHGDTMVMRGTYDEVAQHITTAGGR